MTQKKLTVFTQANCARCPAVKKAIEELKLEKQFTLTELDASSDEGYFEAIKHNIMSTPALVFETEQGAEKLVGDISKEDIVNLTEKING